MGLTGLIVGSTGLVGSTLLSTLLQDNNHWSKIITTSRGSSINGDDRVHHLSIDFADDSIEKIRCSLSGQICQSIDAIFVCTWISNQIDEFGVNVAMLEKLLNAFEDTRPRVILIEGTKTYGCHLGPNLFPDYRTPFDESNYVRHPSPPPNFYFGWHDLMLHRNWPNWATLRPGPVVGPPPISGQPAGFYNFGTGLVIYAALMKSLGKPLIFPARPSSRKLALEVTNGDFVEVQVIADMANYLALTAKTVPVDSYGVPSLNCGNGENFTWRELWPKLASDVFNMKHWSYGIEGDEAEFDLTTLVAQPEVKMHWSKLTSTSVPLDQLANWPVVVGCLSRTWDTTMSLDRSRSFFAEKMPDGHTMVKSLRFLAKKLEADKAIPPELFSAKS